MMIATRTIAARRRSSTQAPTVYMPMNSTMLPTYISGMWKVIATKNASAPAIATTSG